MATLVMKFGGSLMADTKRISRVAQVVLAEALAWKRMVVVVSAMAGATDALRQAVDLAAARNATGYRHIIAGLRDDHLRVIRVLFENKALQDDLIAQIDQALFEALTICDRVIGGRESIARERDAAMAVGERLVVPMIAALLRKEGLQTAVIDAESLIVTDDNHQSAHPIIELTEDRVERLLRPMLENNVVPLVAGFIGATRNGHVTTLGRGGSDYTATILGAALHADEVWIWTHVDGIMSADPALVPGARVIPLLSYEEVSELTYFGARVLHPRTVDPLIQQGIPLRVRNPFNLDHAGTLIQAEAAPGSAVKAVTAVDGLCLVATGRTVDIPDLLGQVRHLVGQAAAGPVMVMQSHLRSVLVFVVPTSEGPNGVANAAQRLVNGLGKWEVSPVKVIAVMGTPASLVSGLNSGITPLMSVVGPGDRRLIAVLPGEMQTAVRQLHKLTEVNEAPQFWPQPRSAGSFTDR